MNASPSSVYRISARGDIVGRLPRSRRGLDGTRTRATAPPASGRGHVGSASDVDRGSLGVVVGADVQDEVSDVCSRHREISTEVLVALSAVVTGERLVGQPGRSPDRPVEYAAAYD